MRFFRSAAMLACVGAIACSDQADLPEGWSDLPEYRVFGEPASPDDGEAIAAFLGQFGAAWGGGDAEALSALYADDAEWINAFGVVVRGSDELRDFFAPMFAAFGDAVSAEESTNARRVSLRFVGADVAVVHNVTISTRGAGRDGTVERRVHITLVLAKEEGTWRIVHQMIMDARE